MTSDLVVHEARRVLQDELVSADRIIPSGQGQAAQGVPAGPVFPDHRQDLVFDARRHGDLVTAHADVSAPVDHSFWGTLDKSEARA